MHCFLLKFKLRSIDAIRAGKLPVTAQLLPRFLLPDDHVYDSELTQCPSRTCHDKGNFNYILLLF